MADGTVLKQGVNPYMIIDSITKASQYKAMNKKIAVALDFLRETDIAALASGKYEIRGDEVFAMVQSYETLPVEEGKWEAHRQYLDVQYVAAGEERMGYANVDSLTVSQPYAEDKDVLFLEGPGDFLTVKAGTFVIFAPQDAHMPCLAVADPRPVKKVVVKVRM